MSKLTKEQREILVGLLLGDGNMQTENNGRTYRFRFSQQSRQKDYLFAVYEIFKPFVTTPPREYRFTDSRTGKKSFRWAFATTQQACFRFYGQLFYSLNGKKKVPKIIRKLLKPKGLAFWYMDDGAQKWAGKTLACQICTDGFTLEDVKLLKSVLEDNFKLQVSINRQRENYRLGISAKSYQTLRNLIFPFLLKTMHYKFPKEE
uniref:Putative LAGLIDADG homing endonuclease n=1 Tax=Jenufa perforata TaxID=993091 RepID=A0A0S2LN67_9CHLO|nr:putative LAGLIDADG homing endonuclease [Jenufa perforata]ALO62917.1 putative LAGLIDADG homing endonuclease [Jenufa perforata]